MSAKLWDEASPLEIIEARLQQAEESVQWLKDCLVMALEQTEQRKGSVVRPEVLLDEEWSK